MRLNGTVVTFIQRFDSVGGKIRIENDDWYKVISSKDISPDCIGRRFLIPGEPVTFQAKSTGRIATNIVRPFAEKSIIPSNHRELAIVIDENFLMRRFGGRLVADRGALDGIPPDSIVSCGVTKSAGHTMWRAVDVRHVAASESEVDWNSEEALAHG